MIDHDAVRELLELAAVEPDGLERLSAGDTAEAAAVAGHLAGCPSCMDEARRLAAAGPVIREVVGSIPPEALRGSTLALVREVGRERGGAGRMARQSPAVEPSAGPASSAVPSPSAVGPSPIAAVPRRRRELGWPVALAAAVVFSLVVGGALGGVLTGRELRDQQMETAALAALHDATLRLADEPDVRRVLLAGSDPASAGTLLFSPMTRDLVVSATGLIPPPAGQELSCWISAPDGSRIRMGRMEFAGGLAYWAGWADELADAGPGTQFGVTRVDASGASIGGDVLVGSVATN